MKQSDIMLIHRLEIEIEESEMLIAQARTRRAACRRTLSSDELSGVAESRCRRCEENCTQRIADLQEYIDDCRDRILRLKKKQGDDIGIAAAIATSLIAIIFIAVAIL